MPGNRVDTVLPPKKQAIFKVIHLLQDAKYLAIPMPRLPDDEIKKMSAGISDILDKVA